MNDLFRGADIAALDAALRLLGGENRAMVRISLEGRILTLTPAAAGLLGSAPLQPVYELLSPQHRRQLQEAVEQQTQCCFFECFHGCYCDVTAEPTGEGALLLIEPREKQTLLDEKLQYDIRNSLQGIISASYTVKTERPQVYEEIRNRMLQIERVLDHVELLQRSADLQAQPRFIMNDLALLCRRAASAFMEQGGPAVEVRAPQKMPAVFDAVLMMRALLNLLTNAAHATQLWVSASHQEGGGAGNGGVFLLSVEDNGEGVPPEELQELYCSWREMVNFRKNFVVNGREKRPGTGLPIVSLIAEYHYGRLLFEARPGGGARFCLSFPDGLLPDTFELECRREPDDTHIIKSELSVLGEEARVGRDSRPNIG